MTKNSWSAINLYLFKKIYLNLIELKFKIFRRDKVAVIRGHWK